MQGCRFNTPNLSASNVQGLKRPSGGSSRFTAPDRHSTVLHVPGRMQSQVQGLLRLIELQSRVQGLLRPIELQSRVQGLLRPIELQSRVQGLLRLIELQSRVQGLLRLIELQSKGSRFTAPDRIEPRVQGLQRSI